MLKQVISQSVAVAVVLILAISYASAKTPTLAKHKELCGPRPNAVCPSFHECSYVRKSIGLCLPCGNKAGAACCKRNINASNVKGTGKPRDVAQYTTFAMVKSKYIFGKKPFNACRTDRGLVCNQQT